MWHLFLFMAYYIHSTLITLFKHETGAGSRRGTELPDSAGASAPEVLVQEVIARLKELGAVSVEELQGISENVVFPLPKALS